MNALKEFYGKFPVVKIAKGTTLFQQSDVPRTGYAIKQGVIKIYNITNSGNEKIVAFKITNEPLPVGWLLSKSTTAMYFYEAHTDCELYVISKNAFTTQIKNDHTFSLRVVETLANAYISATLQIDALTQTRASLKLLYAFRHLSLQYGKDIKEDFSQLQIPLTQQELANYTGLTRETTAAELSKFKAQGVVTYKRKYYTVNTKNMNELIEDEYDPGIQKGADMLPKNLLL